MTAHKNLANADLHEPKGIDTAITSQAGQVLTPSASTSGEGTLRSLTLSEITQERHRIQGTGWAKYLDSTYTSGAKLSVGVATRTKLTNDGAKAGSSSTYLGEGDTEYWSTGTNKFAPMAVGDAYNFAITMECGTASVPDYVDIELDVAGTVIWEERRTIHTIAGTTLCLNIPITVNSAMDTSGAEVYVTPVAASDFWNIDFTITKTHQQA